MNKEFARYTLEALLIFLNVLLALYLENVVEDRRESHTINELHQAFLTANGIDYGLLMERVSRG